MQKKCILLIKTACCYSKKSTLFLPKMRTVSENILHFEHVTYLKEVEQKHHLAQPLLGIFSTLDCVRSDWF